MLKIALMSIGWVFVAVPLIAFLSVSFYMIKGVAKDDETIKAIVMLGYTLFFVGLIILLAMYITNFLV